MASNPAATTTTTTNRRPPPPQPPGNVNAYKFAEARAPELESLHSIISNRVNNDFRSRRNKRRRTTSFSTKNHRHKKKPDKEDETCVKKVSRRVRRRVEFKNNPELGFVVSGDGTKRLRTHLWHAKRFTIDKFWGFYLPLGLHGSGRGSRALLKWCKQGAVVHDASFYSVVQLKGSQEALLSIMGNLLDPFPMTYSEDFSQRVFSGGSFGSAMLHHPGQDSSKAICPVTYSWRPFHHQENDVCAKDEGNNGNVESEFNPNLRQVWIWMHPSASSEGLDCLKLACHNMMNESGGEVDCVSLDGQLGRIDVMGEGSFPILQKILHPHTYSKKSRKLENCVMVEHTDGCEQNNILKKEECFSSYSVVSLEVVDPRLLSRKIVSSVPDANLASSLSEDKIEEGLAVNPYVMDEVLYTLQSKNESTSLPNCKDLWDADQGVQPPLEEHLLCQERHSNSLNFFGMKDMSSAKSIRTKDNFSRLCPILLMRHKYQSGLLARWSIVLPVSWVKAFWVPLVSRGAHAIGLREKHWISCDVGLPYFPSDFPDCNAYSCFMASEAEAIEQTMESRPPARRPFKVPKTLPWNSRSFTFNEGIGQSSRFELSSSVGVSRDHSSDQQAECLDVPPTGSNEILVARTSGALSSFLKEISGDHLLLYPKGLNRDGFTHFMKDETRISQASGVVTSTSQERRLCYLRVHLHAFKEGVFDEGAVVCAPHFSDISLWTSRSDSDETLHVPDAFAGSYFKEQSSGKWDFQLPEDTAAREAYRRPIGFVTTGFVRGSKKPSAVGLCEAVLLARLRLDQWSQTPAKKRRKEIYVVVRNLRSTAYRLSRATILLEEQEDDVESL